MMLAHRQFEREEWSETLNSVILRGQECYHVSAGCAKTYVRLSGTGRNTVRISKPST